MGARPNFVKVAAIVHGAERVPDLTLHIVHTGQHHDHSVSDAVLADLGMRTPDLQLTNLPSEPGAQCDAIRHRLHEPLRAWRPDVVVVVGDVTSTLAGALAADDLRVPVAHVEAGLRSFDTTMPEERNRIAVDRLANLCLATEAVAVQNLLREGKLAADVHMVGNVMIDSLDRCLPKARARARWQDFGLRAQHYGVVTLHRQAAVDDPAALQEILQALGKAAETLPLLFPVHPRTAAAMRRIAPVAELANLHLVPPQGYIDFLSLLAGARCAITDSGGVQEESTVLGVPALVLRNNTERPVTLHPDGCRLIGLSAQSIAPALAAVVAAKPPAPRRPAGWDGAAAHRVWQLLQQRYRRKGMKQAT